MPCHPFAHSFFFFFSGRAETGASVYLRCETVLTTRRDFLAEEQRGTSTFHRCNAPCSGSPPLTAPRK